MSLFIILNMFKRTVKSRIKIEQDFIPTEKTQSKWENEQSSLVAETIAKKGIKL